MTGEWNALCALLTVVGLSVLCGLQSVLAQDAEVIPAGSQHVMTLAGRVEGVDHSARTITLDGKTFDVAKDAEITADERTLTLEDVSVGTNVIAVVDRARVVALSVLPDGQPQ